MEIFSDGTVKRELWGATSTIVFAGVAFFLSKRGVGRRNRIIAGEGDVAVLGGLDDV